MKKQILQLLTGLFPDLFVKMAIKKLTTPQIRKLRERELEVLSTSSQNTIKFRNFNIKTYEWKGTKQRILLVHGWEGQAGNFTDLIKKLKEEGHHIFAFDGPSHGYSSKGKTSLFEFADLVDELIRKYKVKKLISHSFGGVATTYALFRNPEIKIEKYGLLTTPDRFIERIEDISNQYSIHKKVVDKLIIKLETDYKIKVKELNVSTFVKELNIVESIIFHGKEDRVIPIERARNVSKNWKQSTFVEVEGTGHFAILRNESVLNKMIDFIK